MNDKNQNIIDFSPFPKRRKSRRFHIGSVPIGGDAPISIQSMTNTNTSDSKATLSQIAELAAVGCEIVRVAVPDKEAVKSLPEIINNSEIPLIADIHFDYKLALGAIDAGIHGLRLNPGNIGDVKRVEEVAKAAKSAGVPIRVGVNSGSVKQKLIEHFQADGVDREKALCLAMTQSALEQCEILEKCDFRDIKVSLKASDVRLTVAVNRHFAAMTDYPLHLGVTEAGTLGRGIIKSSAGIGGLLLEGIGDTIRVSLTADPVEEVKVAKILLESVGARTSRPEIVSCPSCGRTKIDLFSLVAKVEALIDGIKATGKQFRPCKIAVMGCEVNGPGEAKEADIGIAGGNGKVALFKQGEIIGVFTETEGFERFKMEITRMTDKV